MRIQRTFSEIATKSNEGGPDPDVKTTSASKELSGRPHGPTLPGTSTVCRDKLSPTLSTKASRSKQNWPYHPTGCDTTSGAEAYTTYKNQEPRRATVPVNAQQTTSVPSLQINDRKQESDPEENGYVINCIHENRPFTVNDVGRPVFVNHYYAGEAFIPVTNKRLIKLDECDVLTEISLRNAQPQDIEREFKEYSQNLWIIKLMAEAEREQRHGNAAIHSDL